MYTCKVCKYSTDIHCNYDRHLQTIKHKKHIDKNDKHTNPKTSRKSKHSKCKSCGKLYAHRQSLYKHKQHCKIVSSDNDNTEQLKQQIDVLTSDIKEIRKDINNMLTIISKKNI